MPPAPPPISQSPEPEPPPPAANCVLKRAGAYGGSPLKPGDLVDILKLEAASTGIRPGRSLGVVCQGLVLVASDEATLSFRAPPDCAGACVNLDHYAWILRIEPR